MRDSLRVAILGTAALGITGVATAQTNIEQTRTTYGSRVGDRDHDPNGTGIMGLNDDQRTNQRLESRINSRIDTRLDRFTPPQVDYRSSYTPRIDDGTKRTLGRVVTLQSDYQSAYTREDDEDSKKP